MIALSMLAVAALGLQELPPQQLIPNGCQTFVWIKAEPPVRLTMLDENKRLLRLKTDKILVDLPETSSGSYEGHGYKILLQMKLVDNPHLTGGSIIDSGSIRIERTDIQADSFSYPIGGLRSCQ